VTLSEPPPPSFVIHSSTWVTGWLPANEICVPPSPRVPWVISVVSPSAASADCADRTSTTVPGLGESIDTAVSWTAEANDTMIPMPCLYAGNGCLYS